MKFLKLSLVGLVALMVVVSNAFAFGPPGPPPMPPMGGPPMGGPPMGGPPMGGPPMSGPPMGGPSMSGPPTGGLRTGPPSLPGGGAPGNPSMSGRPTDLPSGGPFGGGSAVPGNRGPDGGPAASGNVPARNAALGPNPGNLTSGTAAGRAAGARNMDPGNISRGVSNNIGDFSGNRAAYNNHSANVNVYARGSYGGSSYYGDYWSYYGRGAYYWGAFAAGAATGAAAASSSQSNTYYYYYSPYYYRTCWDSDRWQYYSSTSECPRDTH